MFSQINNFMNVVESHLVQPQPRRSIRSATGSQDFSPERPDHPLRSSSSASSHNVGGSPVSTSQLAESALTNLRKSLGTRAHARPGTPQGHDRVERQMSPQTDRELRPMAKTNLEERLRATFAIGDASTSTTPEALSHAPSPRPQQKTDKFPSPASTPLPDSPHVISQHSGDNAEAFQMNDPTPPVEVPSAEAIGETTNGMKELNTTIGEDYHTTNSPLPPPSPAEELDLLEATQDALTTDSNSSQNHSGQQVASNHDIPNRAQLIAQQVQREGTHPSSPLGSVDAENRTSFLRATVEAANHVLLECSATFDISDSDALRRYLLEMRNKIKSSESEIQHLSGKLSNYDERFEELRDTHRLESRSQLQLLDSLRQQLQDSSASLSSTRNQLQQIETDHKEHMLQLERLRSESQKLKDKAMEEEEKRTKAISLLKTVRQKLVKAEKERDDVSKELSTVRERGTLEVEKEKAERVKLEREIISVRAEKEKEVAGIKAHFDRESTLVKDRLEKEYAVRVGQVELEALSAKTAHQKEVAALRSQIQTLEGSVRTLNAERDSLFDQVQLRQAELESSQSHLETLQSAASELRFQLREVSERASLLSEELAEVRQAQEPRPLATAEEENRIRKSVEAKYDVKISELNSKISAIEKERADTEAVLTRSIQQKGQEVQQLKHQISSNDHTKGQSDNEAAKLKQDLSEALQQLTMLKSRLVALQMYEERSHEQEALVQALRDDAATQAQHLQAELAAATERENQLRTLNKTLREDLRKVQSSAALLERQRNPGVGYWSNINKQETTDRRQSLSSQSDHASGALSPRGGSPTPVRSDEEVNLEYLRNVILQFLEHKEMRPQLVRVLSIILQFTPQETRRLVSKV